jgi:hypothetical protein
MEVRVLANDDLDEDDGNEAPPGQLKMHPSDNFRGLAITGPGLVTSRVRSSHGSFWLYFRFSFEEGPNFSDRGRAFEVGMFASMVVQSVVFKSRSPVADRFLGRWRIGPLDDWANATMFCIFDHDSLYMKYGLNIVDTPSSSSSSESAGTVFEVGHYAIVPFPDGKILVHFLAQGGRETRYELTEMDGFYEDRGYGWKRVGELGEW